MNILNSKTAPTRTAIAPKAAPAKGAEAADTNSAPSLFDSVTTGMTDVLGQQARPVMVVAGAFAGVQAGLGLARVALNVLPIEAAIPGMVVAGAIGLGAAVVGGKVAWDVGPALVGSAIEQSENIAAKLHLPKGTGKLVASAAWLGSVGSSMAAGGALGAVTTAATAATVLLMGVGAAGGAVDFHRAKATQS